MEPDQHPCFRLRRSDGVAVLTVLGEEIPPEATESLYAAADELANAPEPRHLVLNLEYVTRINSVTIAVLITFQRRAREAGGAVRLCARDPHVLEVFRATKLDQLLDLHASEREAVNAFLGRGGSWVSRIFGPG